MNTLLIVTIKSVYGTDKIYPVNTPAELLARIAGTKTLTLQAIENAMKMGFDLALVTRHGTTITKYDGGTATDATIAVNDLVALYNLA